jgi:hypothetical protein
LELLQIRGKPSADSEEYQQKFKRTLVQFAKEPVRVDDSALRLQQLVAANRSYVPENHLRDDKAWPASGQWLVAEKCLSHHLRLKRRSPFDRLPRVA